MPATSRTPRHRVSSTRGRVAAPVGGIVLVAAAFVVGAWMAGPTPPIVAAADPVMPTVAANLLDDPLVDVAALTHPGPDGAPDLLTVDPLLPGETTVHLSILERDGAWARAASASVDLASDGIARFEQPWLVGLGGDRFALLATSVAAGRTVIVTLAASDDAGRRVLQEQQRIVADAVIDDAGAADVTADGVPDLVVVTIPSNHEDVLCVGSWMRVYDDGRLDVPTDHKVPGLRLAAGTIGSFDAVPGDDLAAYAYPDCTPDHPSRDVLRLAAIRLVDGTVTHDATIQGDAFLARSPGPPVRFDVDGDGRDELLALVTRGLAVIDPIHDWSSIPVASISAFPLAAAPVAQAGGTGTRVAWMEPSIDGRGPIGAAPVRRTDRGRLATGPATVLSGPETGGARWRLAVMSASMAEIRQAPAVGWQGRWPADCPDTIVTTAILSCASGDVVAGPAFIGSRPLLALTTGVGPRILVAAGTEADPSVGLPVTPTPWAGYGPGAWRHGASAGFVLAEVDPDGLLTGRRLGLPTIDPVAAPGPAATIEARSGTRLLVHVAADSTDAAGPAPDVDLQTALSSAGASSVVRVPVVAGAATGGERASVRLPLGDIRMANGGAAGRWRITAIPLSDTGEIDAPVVTIVRLDMVAPELSMPVPPSTPIWPIAATLRGRTEPGASVVVDGVADVKVQKDGAFSFVAPLAPWPQTFRVVATDPSGNRTVTTLTVIGGLDYRTFPWPAIIAIAVLAAVIASGILGTRRRQGPMALTVSGTVPEDHVGPSVEDLPPSDGLGPPTG